MSAAKESLGEKQRRLAGEIARQRTHLAGAYRDIAKPILYTEYSLRGFGFLRQNPWILTVIPASLSTTTSAVALIRALTAKAVPAKFKWFGGDADKGAKHGKKTLSNAALKWGGHGWRAFKTYRRVRKFLT